MEYLKQGQKVIVVGSSAAKGNNFIKEAKKIDAEHLAFFIQADLSVISENHRVIEHIKREFPSLDTLVLCAVSMKYRENYTITKDGFELTFALYYLSRYILSYGLKELLEKSSNPVILNLCAPGMKGNLQWEDIEFKNNFNSMNAQFHGSRLNVLLAVSFNQQDTVKKINYILYNPMAVRTAGVADMFGTPSQKAMMKVMYKFIGKSVDDAIIPMVKLINNPPVQKLSAFKTKKAVNLEMDTFNGNNARRLADYTRTLLNKYQ